MKKLKCYNCKYSGYQFKIGKLTHLHCCHPKYKEEDFLSGKLSAWDTLRVFSDTCENHQYKDDKFYNSMFNNDHPNPCK